jgi:hypothetical protein
MDERSGHSSLFFFQTYIYTRAEHFNNQKTLWRVCVNISDTRESLTFLRLLLFVTPRGT